MSANAYYQVITAIKEELLGNDFTNQVKIGSLADVDFNKQSIYPLGNIQVESVVISQTYRFTVSVLLMDLVFDEKQSIAADVLSETGSALQNDTIFRKTDNEQDVLNTQLYLINRLVASLKRGSLRVDGYELINEPTAEPFSDRLPDAVAGWSTTLEFHVSNTVSSCGS